MASAMQLYAGFALLVIAIIVLAALVSNLSGALRRRFGRTGASRSATPASRSENPCSASTIFADRIDSRFLLPERSQLPHVNCYPAAELRGGGGDGEATEHGNTPRAEGCD